jgi:hypothetical protein
MPEKFTEEEFDVLATAPAETTEPRQDGAWRDAPEDAIEHAGDASEQDPSA